LNLQIIIKEYQAPWKIDILVSQKGKTIEAFNFSEMVSHKFLKSKQKVEYFKLKRRRKESLSQILMRNRKIVHRTNMRRKKYLISFRHQKGKNNRHRLPKMVRTTLTRISKWMKQKRHGVLKVLRQQ
jgi:hypothetical protein